MSRAAAAPPADERPRVGRPPRISRAMIVEAAHEIGLEGLTLKAVADHLGVSIAALYHHVSGKDDLMRLAAEYSVQAVPMPEDRGQHWADWLLEWAMYNRNVFLSQPALLSQYLEGAIAADVIAARTDAILGVLVRQGFAIDEALAAYDLVASASIGAAVAIIRERTAVERGAGTVDEYRRVLGERGPDELPHLRMLLDAPSPAMVSFKSRIVTLLTGIAARRGDNWRDIATLLDVEMASSRRHRRR